MNIAGVIIALAVNDVMVARCHPVMLELRPHQTDLTAFTAQVARQRAQGYQLAFLEAEGEVCAVAGYRISEKLSAGRFLYVDDLVTRAADCSQGYGGRLFDWLIEQARQADCTQLQLDSAVWRHGAHRFYLRKGMNITSHHFDVKLSAHREEVSGTP